MEALGPKRRSAIFATALVAASAMLMPQSAKAGNLLNFLAHLGKTDTQPAATESSHLQRETFNPADGANIKPLAAPLEDKILVFDLKTGTIRNSAGQIVFDHIRSGLDSVSNNSEFEKEKRKGPIPSGWYTVDVERHSPNIYRQVLNLDAIDGTVHVHNRADFRVHQIFESEGGTEGCVGTTHQAVFKQLSAWQKEGKFLYLRVDPSFGAQTAMIDVSKIKLPKATQEALAKLNHPQPTTVAKQKPDTTVAKATTPPAQPPQSIVQAPVEEPKQPWALEYRWPNGPYNVSSLDP